MFVCFLVVVGMEMNVKEMKENANRILSILYANGVDNKEIFDFIVVMLAGLYNEKYNAWAAIVSLSKVLSVAVRVCEDV